MKSSSAAVGVLFGVLLTAVLVVPLYVVLPGRYLNDWFYIHDQAGLFAVVGALALWCGAGAAGAWTHPDEAVRAGTATGTLAGLVAGALLVVPAAAVESCSDLLLQIQTSPPGGVAPSRMRALLSDATLGAMWLPTLASLGMLMTGPALGAVGGVIYDLSRGLPSPTTREVRRSSVPLTGLLVTCLSFAGQLWLLRELETVYLPSVGFQLGFVERAQLAAPVALVGVLACAFGWWMLRDAAVLYRAGLRFWGFLWAMMGMPVLPVLLVEAAALYPVVYTTPGAWLAIVGTGFVLLVGLIMSARSDDLLPNHPRDWSELLGQALQHGVVAAAVPVFLGLSSVATLWVIVRPYAEAVAGTGTAVAWPPRTAVQLVMQGHWVLALVGVVVALVYFIPAVPVLGFVRMQSRD